MAEPAKKSDAQLRAALTPEQYEVTQHKGTERPFTGEYWNHFAEGQYRCVVCGELLFDSSTKFDAGCGWPSFSSAEGEDTIQYLRDSSHGMERIEVRCASCEGHLGHVFNDGPGPTGMRYCINSASLKLDPKD